MLVLVLALGYGIIRKTCRLGALIIGVIALIFLIVGASTDKIIYKENSGASEYYGDIEEYTELEKGVTAIVLNHDRPHNIKPSVKSLIADPNVKKVILLNGKEATRVVLNIKGVERNRRF